MRKKKEVLPEKLNDRLVHLHLDTVRVYGAPVSAEALEAHIKALELELAKKVMKN